MQMAQTNCHFTQMMGLVIFWFESQVASLYAGKLRHFMLKVSLIYIFIASTTSPVHKINRFRASTIEVTRRFTKC